MRAAHHHVGPHGRRELLVQLGEHLLVRLHQIREAAEEVVDGHAADGAVQRLAHGLTQPGHPHILELRHGVCLLCGGVGRAGRLWRSL